MKRRAFTLVELMMVVVILSVLLTIVFSSVKNSLQGARSRRASALCSAVETGLATYYAQKDEWPDPLGAKVANGSLRQSNDEGANNQTDSDRYVLEASEVRQMVKALVDEAKLGNPLMDISGLFVSRDPGERGSKGFGLDFFDAVHGTKQSHTRMSTSEMYFGYPDPATGRFRRFKMVYSIPTDKLTVMQQ